MTAAGHGSNTALLQQSDRTQNPEAFVWTKHWYPLLLEADVDAQNPSPHTLLNINIVIWKDGEGKWGACEDKCPHRSVGLHLLHYS